MTAEEKVKAKYPKAACIYVPNDGFGGWSEIWTGGKVGEGKRLEFCPVGPDGAWRGAAHTIMSGLDERLAEGGGIIS